MAAFIYMCWIKMGRFRKNTQKEISVINQIYLIYNIFKLLKKSN